MKTLFLVIALATISHCQNRPPQRKCCRVQSQFKKFGPGIEGNPVAVNVGSCPELCPGVSTATITDGTIDYFVGPEPASLGPYLIHSLLLDQRLLVGFDTFSHKYDRFAHTVRLPPNCRSLARMSVKICLNASESNTEYGDALIFEDPLKQESLYEVTLVKLFDGYWRWMSSGCKTINFGPSDKVFQYAVRNNYYHVIVRDEVGVDYIQTTLSYESQQKCIPSLWTPVDVPLATGIEKVDKIIGCKCQQKGDSRCLRQPKKVVFYKDSKFEKTIDVGYCNGSCRQVPHVPLPTDDVRNATIDQDKENGSASGQPQVFPVPASDPQQPQAFPVPALDPPQLTCQPVSIDRVNLRGPHGLETVEVVKQCECKPQCYRMPYFKQVVGVSKKKPNGILSAEKRTFDVGKCVGTCDRAVHSDVTNLGNQDCSDKCSPRGYEYARLLKRDGSYVSVPLITTCDCKRI